MDEYNWKEIEKKLKNTLDGKRYRHTLGVSYTAAALAMAHGEDIKKARLAGLLHDCAKCVPEQERIPMCEEYGISLTPCEISNTALIHAKLGVVIAKRDYLIKDEDILGAIRWHTTGKPEMSALEQIIYIADYIEPNRDAKLQISSEIRKTAFKDLDAGCEAVMGDIVAYLNSTGYQMDEMTYKAYDYYHELISRR